MKQIDILKNTGVVLTRLRKATGKSQRDFADEIGLAYSAYNRHENGHQIIDMMYINKYAEAHGITMAELVAMIQDPDGVSKLQKEVEQLSMENEALRKSLSGKAWPNG